MGRKSLPLLSIYHLSYIICFLSKYRLIIFNIIFFYIMVLLVTYDLLLNSIFIEIWNMWYSLGARSVYIEDDQVVHSQMTQRDLRFDEPRVDEQCRKAIRSFYSVFLLFIHGLKIFF